MIKLKSKALQDKPLCWHARQIRINPEALSHYCYIKANSLYLVDVNQFLTHCSRWVAFHLLKWTKNWLMFTRCNKSVLAQNLKGSGPIAHYISCSCSIMRQFPHDGSTSLPSDFMLSLIIWWNVWVENQDIHDHEKQGPLEKWTEHFRFAWWGGLNNHHNFTKTYHFVIHTTLWKIRYFSNEMVFVLPNRSFCNMHVGCSFHFFRGPCVKAVDDSSNHRHYLLTFMTSICHENSTGGGDDGSSSQKSICPPSIVLLAG